MDWRFGAAVEGRSKPYVSPAADLAIWLLEDEVRTYALLCYLL